MQAEVCSEEMQLWACQFLGLATPMNPSLHLLLGLTTPVNPIVHICYLVIKSRLSASMDKKEKTMFIQQ